MKMEDKDNTTLLCRVDKQTTLTDVLRAIEKTCQNCRPLTPITCISGCKTWRLKNQLRKLHEKTTNPDFMTNLLNTLKNKRRLQLLEMLSKKHHSITQLQQELRKLGFNHGQQTIIEEYVNPLITLGLADEHQNLYYATLFGQKISDLTKDFHDLEHVLSPHSECYEEITLGVLMKGPRTCEELKEIIPEKSVARVLGRLQKAALAETSTEKDYIFFFKTKRDPNGSEFSPTEKRVYERIPEIGISARKLAKEAGISLRRTYKYLRKLKGKKLVFTRKRPASYSITAMGLKIGRMLEEMHNLAAEALTATGRLVEDEQASEQVTLDIEPAGKKRKDEQIVSLTTMQPGRRNSSFCEDSHDPRMK
jgi:predicted transcriptional regulator